MPQDDSQATSLLRSRLHETIPNLVRSLSGDSAGDGDQYRICRLISRLWTQSRRLRLSFNVRAVASYVKALLDLKSPEANRCLAHQVGPDVGSMDISRDGFSWSQDEIILLCDIFVDEAAGISKKGSGLTISQTLQVMSSLGIRSASWTWGRLADKVRQSASPDLFRQLWSAGQPCCAVFTNAAWGLFLKSALECGCTDMIPHIWQATEATRQKLAGGGWSALAKAAGRCNNPSLLNEMWHGAAGSGELPRATNPLPGKYRLSLPWTRESAGRDRAGINDSTDRCRPSAPNSRDDSARYGWVLWVWAASDHSSLKAWQGWACGTGCSWTQTW